MVALACRRGWLAADGATNRYRIAPPGLEALRRARSRAPAPAVMPVQTISSSKALLRSTPAERGAQASPLAWLRRRKDSDGQPLITEPQFVAGERLAADFWRAQLNPRVTVNWSGTTLGRRRRRAAPGAGVDMSDSVVAARARVHRALLAVGSELAGILVDVCCHDLGLEAAGRTRGWPQRAAKVVLQLALTSLARHYGLLAPQPSPATFGRHRHWGDADYRPNLDAWRS
jgi:hypothetical protein